VEVTVTPAFTVKVETVFEVNVTVDTAFVVTVTVDNFVVVTVVEILEVAVVVIVAPLTAATAYKHHSRPLILLFKASTRRLNL